MDNNHLLSINVEDAKVRIQRLQSQIGDLESFIECAENYNPIDFNQKVIRDYAELGSIVKVTNKINEESQEKKYTTSDVVKIIDSKPSDKLHEHVRRIYRTNKRNASTRKRKY